MPKYCPKCGNENKKDSTFCRGCGERLSQIHTTNNNKSGKNEKILIVIIIALIVLITSIGTYTFINMNNNTIDADDTITTANITKNTSNETNISKTTTNNDVSSNYMKYDPYDYMYDAYNNKMYWVDNDGYDGSYFHPEDTYGPLYPQKH